MHFSPANDLQSEEDNFVLSETENPPVTKQHTWVEVILMEVGFLDFQNSKIMQDNPPVTK